VLLVGVRVGDDADEFAEKMLTGKISELIALVDVVLVCRIGSFPQRH
jgi:hypothetical protein